MQKLTLVFPQPIALLQGERWAEKVAHMWALAVARNRLASLESVGVMWWDWVSSVLRGKYSFPLVPDFTSRLLPLWESDVPSMDMFWCSSSGTWFCRGGNPRTNWKSMGSRTPHAEECRNCCCGGKRARWLQTHPWPQEGGLRWHLLCKVSCFEVRSSSIYVPFLIPARSTSAGI